jgi:hypothetical protein
MHTGMWPLLKALPYPGHRRKISDTEKMQA